MLTHALSKAERRLLPNDNGEFTVLRHVGDPSLNDGLEGRFSRREARTVAFSPARRGFNGSVRIAKREKLTHNVFGSVREG